MLSDSNIVTIADTKSYDVPTLAFQTWHLDRKFVKQKRWRALDYFCLNAGGYKTGAAPLGLIKLL